MVQSGAVCSWLLFLLPWLLTHGQQCKFFLDQICYYFCSIKGNVFKDPPKKIKHKTNFMLFYYKNFFTVDLKILIKILNLYIIILMIHYLTPVMKLLHWCCIVSLQNEDSDTRNASDHSDIVKPGESKFKSLKVKVVYIVINIFRNIKLHEC